MNCGAPAGTQQLVAPNASPALEQTLFNERGVYISNIRFISNAQTYAISGVTSVGSAIERPSKFGAVVLMLLGAFIAFLGLIVLLFSKAGLVGILLGFGIVALGVVVWRSLTPTFIVLLRSASGERKATTNKDEAFIMRIVGALNHAIVIRG
jgi:hypothetical protein